MLSPLMLKKYISFAKHTVFPRLSLEAAEVLKNYYIKLRDKAYSATDSIPITSRQLDSLIRLS